MTNERVLLPGQATVNGIRLFYAEAGSGPPVVLLHGFPETHRSWDLQVPALVAAGFRVIAPDLRGYGRSERTRGGYELENLARDVVGLIDALGLESVRLVGHDWGGAITWLVASLHPDRLERAVIIDCPHPSVMARALRVNARQRRRSWYMFFFQLPLLPERWLARNDGRNIERMFRAGSPGASAVPRELILAEKRALLEPGALGAALAYYRTAFRSGLLPMLRGGGPEFPPIDLPVCLIWGEADSCLGLELIDGTERWARRLRVEKVAQAGHFVHQERPELVNRILLDALR
jgi:epoxide hydrolase 4